MNEAHDKNFPRDRKVTVENPSKLDIRDGFYKSFHIGYESGGTRINLTKGEYDQLCEQISKDMWRRNQLLEAGILEE